MRPVAQCSRCRLRLRSHPASVALDVAARGSEVPSPVGPEFPEGARMGLVRSDPGVSSRSLTVQGNLALGARRAPCARLEILRDWPLAGRQSEVRTSWD